MHRLLSLFTGLLLPFSTFANYDVERVAQGLSIPWAIEFVTEHQLIINEKDGKISLLDLNNGQAQRLYTINHIFNSGQGGLLDVASYKDSTGNTTLFFSYSKPTPEGATLAVAKADFINDQVQNFTELFVADATSDTSRHFGSRIEVVDGHLFVSVGDRGERDNGQDVTTHAATIIRLNLQGNAPIDNPFSNHSEALPEIWSYGHRNPQGLFYDEPSQTLWSIEHGPRGGDEINRIEKGANYGWARVSHGREYWGPLDVGEAKSLPGMVDPELVYVPSIAPSNIVLYRGNKYPELDGKLLAGALKLAHINVVEIKDNQLHEHARILESLNERIRDITISPTNEIFFSTDNGNIYRLISKQPE